MITITNGAEFRAAILGLGLTVNGLSRLMVRLGDDRPRDNIHRSVQRMISGDGRISGEMRALVNALELVREARPDVLAEIVAASAADPADDTQPAPPNALPWPGSSKLAFIDGWKAYEAGVGMSACGYPPQTPARNLWMEGWSARRQAAMDRADTAMLYVQRVGRMQR